MLVKICSQFCYLKNEVIKWTFFFTRDHAIARNGGDSLASLQILKIKANEIVVSVTNSTHNSKLMLKDHILIPESCDNQTQMKTEKFVKPREPIDFAHYRSKCNLTKSGFLVLEVSGYFADSSLETIHQTSFFDEKQMPTLLNMTL